MTYDEMVAAEVRQAALDALRPWTLPADAPGAWARAAIDEETRAQTPDRSTRPGA